MPHLAKFPGLRHGLQVVTNLELDEDPALRVILGHVCDLAHALLGAGGYFSTGGYCPTRPHPSDLQGMWTRAHCAGRLATDRDTTTTWPVLASLGDLAHLLLRRAPIGDAVT